MHSIPVTNDLLWPVPCEHESGCDALNTVGILDVVEETFVALCPAHAPVDTWKE